MTATAVTRVQTRLGGLRGLQVLLTRLRRRRPIVGVLCLGLAALGLSAPGAAAASESIVGSWETLAYDSQYTTIHAAVLRTGKVFIMAGSENIPENLPNNRLNGSVWDPKTGTMTPLRPPFDMFCSAHAFLPDGKLLIAGGTEAYPTDEYLATGGASGVYYRGSKGANLFDPVTQQFEAVPDMAAGRWYPTLVGRGDGDVLAMSGLDINSEINTVPEVYKGSASGGTWRQTPAISSSWPLYPHLSLLKSGKMFYSGGFIDNYNVGTLNPGFLDVDTSQFTPIPRLSVSDRREAATVLLPPAQSQKAMIIGGGDPAVRNVDIIDLSAASPSYTPAPPMRTPRLHVSAVLLADGKVFITGGGQRGRGEAPVFETEIYDPATNSMTAAANSSVPRVYHSVAMLLPDGRVATAGGQPVYGARGELRIEVYSPPYMFKGGRPAIATATQENDYGGQMTLEIGGGSKAAGKIKTLNLVRPASVTHSFDSEQRVVPMTFQRSGSKLLAQIPQDRNVAPPGWYMLFALNDQGVPSVASWVRIKPDAGMAPSTTTTTMATTTTTVPATTTTVPVTTTTVPTGTSTTVPATTTTTTPPATTTTTTPPSSINVLDVDTAGIETSSGHWTPWYSADIVRSEDQPYSGIASLRVNATSNYGWGVALNNWPGFAATSGNHRIGFWSRLGSGTTPSVTMRVKWRNDAGSDLRVDTVTVPNLSTQWQHATADVVAPSGTTRVALELVTNSGGVGSSVFFDDFTVART